MAKRLWLLVLFPLLLSAQEREFLNWPEAKCMQVGKDSQRKGSISGRRTLLSTERSHSYKLKATWFTPELIRASARLLQLRRHLTNEQTLQMVKESEAGGGTVVMVELDPNEGSGVIPSDWHAFLKVDTNILEGKHSPELRTNPIFQGVSGRNYDYDRLWVRFPSSIYTNGFAELTIEIEGKRASVSWPMPNSLRSPTLATN